MNPELLTNALNRFDPFTVELISIPFCFVSIILLYRFFGSSGVYVFIALAIVGANIQVLKPVKFSFFESPVALGTVLFSTIYFCTDLLSEFEGKKASVKAVWLGFIAMLIWSVLMLLTIGYAPLSKVQAGEEWSWALEIQNHLKAIFLPVPVFFISSIFSFLISQLHDVWLYDLLKKLTRGKYLWLRNNASTLISALIDNTVFSLLAWYIFASEPLPLPVIIWTFILGTYVFRVGIALLDTPFLYLAKFIIKADGKHEK